MRDSTGRFVPLDDPWAGASPDDAVALLDGFERRWRAVVTVHDMVGALQQPDGSTVLPIARLSHRHPVCHAGRPEVRDIEARCLTHCYQGANARAGCGEGAFAHTCWRGQREVVVPVHRGGVHCLTLFVLPVLTKSRRWPEGPELRDIVADAHLLGERLLRAMGGETPGGDSDRQRTVQHLLAQLPHRPLALEDVARALGVSPSRASHVVADLFGKPWRELVIDARIAHAKRLLHQGVFKVAQVATLCGYDDPNTFNRIFRKRVGLSPQRWRRTEGQGE